MRYLAFLFTTFACFGFVSKTLPQVAPDFAKTGGDIYRTILVYAPAPPYPHEAVLQRLVGSGMAVLEVDKRTGNVKSARMQPSTGHKVLDDAALSACKQWRFNPQKMEQLDRSSGVKPTSSMIWKVKIPIAYTMR